MKRALIIEDDVDIAELIELHLSDLKFEVEKFHDGKNGFIRAMKNNFDLIVLDIMLPGMEGMTICTKLRNAQVKTPIIMLTAKADEIDQVLGLESGADVYITKPFSVLELKSRIKALFRRIDIERKDDGYGGNKNPSSLKYDELSINLENKSLHIRGQRIDLTPKEFELLALLASHPGRSYSRDELLRKVWGYEYNAYEHTVNSHINRLRAKIEPDMSSPKYILTTWGVGYRFLNS
ncbi:response regulator transcription factor [Membranihabitans maritimus]|uniref:response regulator transcription factor n=1 Tax=Membranihabitans maritimus TaxID=2904244 RepID=UPI001F2BCD13|nr:response regulator transcription factor [Membranihabitans maritimus]